MPALVLSPVCVLTPSPPSVPVPAVSPHGIPHWPCPNRTWDCHVLSLPRPLPGSWSSLRLLSPPHCMSTPCVNLLNTAFKIEPAASYLITFSTVSLVPPPPPAVSSQKGQLHRAPFWSQTPGFPSHTEENLRPWSPALPSSPLSSLFTHSS